MSATTGQERVIESPIMLHVTTSKIRVRTRKFVLLSCTTAMFLEYYRINLRGVHASLYTWAKQRYSLISANISQAISGKLMLQDIISHNYVFTNCAHSE